MYDFRFRRQNYCFFYDMSDYKNQKMLYLCSRKSLEKGAILAEKSYQKGVRVIKKSL